MKKKRNSIWLYIKNYKADSLFIRNLVLLLVLFLLPFIIMSLAYYRNIEKTAKDKMEAENSTIIYEARDVLDTVIGEFDSMCSYVANDSSVQMFMMNDWFVNLDEGSSADLFRSLNMAKYVYPYVDSVYVYSEFNEAVINDNKMTSKKDFADMTWYNEYRNITDRKGITIARSERGVYPLIMSIIKPIYVDNERKGAVVLNINSSKLYRSVASVNYGDEQNIFLVNGDGKIIMTKVNEFFGLPAKSISYLYDISEDVNGFIREVDGEKCLISSVPSRKFDFYYINISSAAAYLKNLYDLRIQIAFLIVMIFILSVVLAYFAAMNNYRPVTEIISVLDDPNNFDLSGNMSKFNEIRYISKSIVEKSKESEIIQKELEDKLKKLKAAQLEMLQAQINPHFLYNTLETINWMAVDLTKSRNNVSKAVSNLAKFFRTNINDGDYMISVKEEVERTRYYLNILEMRYSDMFSVEWDIDESILDYLVVKICLQPIIENAVYHGLKPKRDKGRLIVSAVSDNENIVFTIEDDGVGITEEKLNLLNSRLSDADFMGDSHIGLYNINKRIKIVFGEEFGIRVDSIIDAGTKVYVTIPRVIYENK